MTFISSLQQKLNSTYTENGALAAKSSFDPVVDFFALAGAMRDMPSGAVKLFEQALYADRQTALRTLFYLRDVRGGQGEREVFRACWRWLTAFSPELAGRLLAFIPEYGRWDDVWSAGVTREVLGLVRGQLDSDVSSWPKVSLLGKWLPSEKSAESDVAHQFMRGLGMSPRQYRQRLSALRRQIGLLESQMSTNDWDNIEYGKLPSQAHRKHVKAFWRHSEPRYQEYLDAVDRGEAKINTSTLYPYEVYDLAERGDRAADTMWANLPDYTNGTDALVLADVSGSMWGRPISVSVSLALYFAERNTGAYKGYFMCFESVPHLVKVSGRNLRERLASIQNSTRWCGSTNLEGAFNAILAAGVQSGEVPKVLYIVSDMQFDQAVTGGSDTTFRNAKAAFAAHGLELPHVVFWNVNARQTQFPATIRDGAVTLVSGCSPTVFGMAVEGKSPRELVDEVVNAERYQVIEV